MGDQDGGDAEVGGPVGAHALVDPVPAGQVALADFFALGIELLLLVAPQFASLAARGLKGVEVFNAAVVPPLQQYGKLEAPIGIPSVGIRGL